VVAEGVTSEAMRSMLEEMGCPLGQGYLFTAPFEAAELDLFVTGRRVSAPVYEIGPGGA
jgi:EAL domain-containing protein (putative c-di-GMP-specific phosphodiesterase class I)